MSKSLLKDIFRTIKRTFSRFVSIAIIIALGTGVFVGMKAASPSMNETAEKLEAAIRIERDPQRKKALEAALHKIEHQYRKLSRLFTAAYNDNSFTIADMEAVM